MADLAGLQRLFAWLSPAWPVGGFAYSHGIEQAIAEGWLTGPDEVQGWIAEILRHGAGRNDAILLAHAWRGEDVAELALALSGCAERRRETAEQGASFARTASAVEEALPAVPYPVAIGMAAARAGLPLAEVLVLFLQAFASNLVTACVKSIPIGPTRGQCILAALMPLIREVAAEAQAATLDDLGGCAFRSDLAAIRHETLQPRIYRT
ncbi:urease accessory protein UreF [Paracoccus binzhouensis]|uniref:urease accessory protein UreF n=1 Tax=Paracoccus binzhouensis TaxID=2796149 RepID=UPI0018EF1BF3|nr:urease accessory UreF family protein [Paracoccus binzhouensis]